MVVIVDSKLVAYNVSYQPRRSLIDVFEIVQYTCEELEHSRQDKVTKVIFVFDYGKSSYRLGMWPQYKAGRNYTQVAPDFQDNYRNKLPALAEALGISVVGVEGVEADDLAGILINDYKGDEDVICLTADKDWIQLTLEDPRVHVFDYKKNDYLYSECNTVAQFLVEKVIKGDDSDNIKGLKMCGDACFEKFLGQIKTYEGVDTKTELAYIREDFLKLANSKKAFDVYPAYKEFGIDTYAKMYDFNIDLGMMMVDHTLLTAPQFDEYKAAVTMMKHPLSCNIANIQTLAAEISGDRTGLFGDAMEVPRYIIDYFKDI